MRNTQLFRCKIVERAVVTAVLFLLCLLPIQAESADWSFSAVIGNPVVVDGRILTKDKTGDVCDWVEIAQNGKYSLIIRKNFLNQQEFNYGNPLWQSVTYGYDYMKNDYMVSRVRHNINHWFNIGIPLPNKLGISGVYDVLPWTARLRDFTMQSSATRLAIGTSNYRASLTDGISKPTIYQVGIGDDVAFALSFGEAAEYASIMRFMRNEAPALWDSPPNAQKNFKKIVIPTGTDSNYGVWLRSPGDNTTAGGMSNIGTVFQYQLNSVANNQKLYIYPALWVDSDIFGNAPKKPMVIPPQPVVVDGRVLTQKQTGDISEWVEIAKSDGFSLIVRKNFINQQEFNYNNPLWQSVNYAYDFKSNEYLTSRVRHYINHWFNIGTPIPNNLNIPGVYDVLPWDARMRKYTVQNTAAYNIGTSTTKAALTDGFGRPSVYQVGIGDDVAFALSYGEAANFLSKVHYVRGVSPALQPSNLLAEKNYNKINFPPGNSHGMWLRSPGDVKETAATLSNNTYHGAVFQYHVSATATTARGFIYPAVWVGSGIFGEEEATINEFHRDAVTGNLLEPQGVHPVAPGSYGPYNAKTFAGYGAGYLASYSDPHQGTIRDGETINITYLYPPDSGQVFVIYTPNGGEGMVNIVPVPRNSYYTIVDQGYTMYLYNFANWNTLPNGLGLVYENGDRIFVTDTIVLYAQWRRGI